MSLPLTIAQVQALIADNAPQAIGEGIAKISTLYRALPKRAPSNAKGPKYRVEVEENASTGRFTPGGTLLAAGARQTQPAAGAWGNYHGSFKLAERELLELAEASAMGTNLVANEVVSQLKSMRMTIAADVHTDTCTGTATNGIIGLASAIDDTNTYMGLNRSTYSAYACYVNDNSGTPRAISTTLLNATHDYLTQTLGGRATAILCGVAQWNAIAGLTGVTNDAPRTGPGMGLFVDYTDIFYRGMPVIKVPGYTTGRVDFIDEDALWYEVLKDFGPPVQWEGTNAVERDGDQYKFLVTGYLQLVLGESPRMQAASLQDLS